MVAGWYVVESTASLWNPLCRHCGIHFVILESSLLLWNLLRRGIQFVVVVGVVAGPHHDHPCGGGVGCGYYIHLNSLVMG